MTTGTYTRGYDFERTVANLYRLMGAVVVHDTSLAGNQIDILVNEKTPAGVSVRAAVECKAYSSRVGIDVVNEYAVIVEILRQKRLIDKAILVSQNGFTANARAAGDSAGIELLEFADLEALAKNSFAANKNKGVSPESSVEAVLLPSKSPQRIFALIPFGAEFRDVYRFGIRGAAEVIGMVSERADDVEHSGGIIELIRERIARSDFVVADTSGKNANVFYEIGYCHGIGKQTILISRKGEEIPFDLKNLNHIFYTSIEDLQERLVRRLNAEIGST